MPTEIGSKANGFAVFAYTDSFDFSRTFSYYEPNVFSQTTMNRILNDASFTKTYDGIQNVPYAFSDNIWVSYENRESLKDQVN
jgi:hypothetical protein